MLGVFSFSYLFSIKYDVIISQPLLIVNLTVLFTTDTFTTVFLGGRGGFYRTQMLKPCIYTRPPSRHLMGDCGPAQPVLILLNILLKSRSSCSPRTPSSTHTKACHSQQLAYNLTYKYHCTVGATCLLAEGKRNK